MSEPSSEIQFVNVTKETLLAFIKEARTRILIAKPGYTKAEVETLVDLVKMKAVECTVCVDPDETAVRYGFGEAEALKIAGDNTSLLNLQTIKGIRLSVVIRDDKALILTPAALSWEEEPRELTYPNGLEGGKTLVNQLLAQFNTTDSAPALPKNVTNFPTVTIQEIRKAVTQETLKETIAALEKNPPVDPAALRQVNIYRNLYKLMKFQIRGVQVKNKTLNLKPFNKMFPQSNKHLKRSWQVFSSEDVERISEFPGFRKEILDLVAQHTVDAGRHGFLIALDKKKVLEELIAKKEKGFMESLKKAEGPGNALVATLNESRTGLLNYLIEEVNSAKQLPEALFARNRVLLKRLRSQDCSGREKAEIVKEAIEDFVTHDLKFPAVDKLIDAIDISLDYYDVSDELLHDEEFKSVLSEAGIKPRKYDEGYEKETGQNEPG